MRGKINKGVKREPDAWRVHIPSSSAQACPDANVYARGVAEMYASAVSSAVVKVVGYGKRR